LSGDTVSPACQVRKSRSASNGCYELLPDGLFDLPDRAKSVTRLTCGAAKGHDEKAD
jgi:hypothetical protein